ncbi:MAG: hypothetical protein F6K63_22180 [Moorea sp. SIO1G6]|nr:hypothetical protein [Moorena sp. SIO1G6]
MTGILAYGIGERSTMTFELVWAYEEFVGVFLLCYRWFQGVSQLHPSMVTRYRQPVVYDPSLG